MRMLSHNFSFVFIIVLINIMLIYFSFFFLFINKSNPNQSKYNSSLKKKKNIIVFSQYFIRLGIEGKHMAIHSEFLQASNKL